VREIQRKMSERAVELLALPPGEQLHLLDVGCGSGLSGEVNSAMVTHNMVLLRYSPQFGACFFSLFFKVSLFFQVLSEQGHLWTGVDVSPSMLEVARAEGSEGELLVVDIGEGLPFRPGSFDGAISISTVQWLCKG
jgi:18S rRNA (guanine1575-N7)-methyltransferase